MNVPNFLIPGAQKAGTTFLASCLKQHPGISMSPLKEVHFFDDDGKYGLGLDYYRTFFRSRHGGNSAVGTQEVVGEATPVYMFLDHVPVRIHALLPDVKLIFVLRNPAERAWSHYWHEVRKGREPYDFIAAIEKENERLLLSDRHRREKSYIARGRYLEKIRRFEKYFPREQMHFVISEQLRSNTAGELKKVYRFLGVDDSVSYDPGEVGKSNVGLVPKNRMVAWVTHNTPLKKITAVTRLVERFNQKGPVPRMPDDIRNKLKEIFRMPNRELLEYLGLPEDTW